MIEISSKTSLNIKTIISIFYNLENFIDWISISLYPTQSRRYNISYTLLLGFIPFVTRRLTAFTSSTVADRWDLRFVVLLFSKFGAAWIPQKAGVWSKFSSAHEMVLILSYERNEQHVKELASRAPNVHRIYRFNSYLFLEQLKYIDIKW